MFFLQATTAAEPSAGLLTCETEFPLDEVFQEQLEEIKTRLSVSQPTVKNWDRFRLWAFNQARLFHQKHPQFPKPPQFTPDTPKYQIYVPSTKPEQGLPRLMVWCWPGVEAKPEIPDTLQRVADELNLLVVSPWDAGNDKPTIWRLFRAIEALKDARSRFEVEPGPALAMGFSGGGKIAAELGMMYPEHVGMSISICGTTYWRSIPVPGEKDKFYPGFWEKPDATILRRAKEQTRFVLVTGSNDFNRDSTVAVRNLAEKDGFQHIRYIEVPGLGHDLPGVDVLLDALRGP